MKHSLLKSDLCRLGAVFATLFLGLAGALSQTSELAIPLTNSTGYFDLSQGFSTAANPAGPWTFGWKESIASSNLTVITYGKSFTSENGVPLFAWLEADDKQPSVSKVIGPGLAISAEGQFQAMPGTIYVTAGEDGTPRNFVVVRFTVPLNGTYRLLADVRDVFDGSFQGDTDFHITRNQVEFFSRALPPHATATASNYLALAAGDQIEFLVGRGEDGHREGSGLKLAATLTRIGSTPTPPPPPLPPGSFDLSANFSLTSNPAGPWSYGRLAGLTGPFELLPNTRTFGAENGVPIGIWYREAVHKPWVAKVLGPGTAISYEFNSPAGTVYFGADPDSDPADFGGIRFTVPDGRGGIYRLMTSVRSLYDNARSTDTDFHVLRNGQELFSHLVPANSGIAYSNVFVLAAGDRIDFAAGRGSGDPNSGLKIQATLTPFFSGTNVPPRPPPVPIDAFDLSRDFSLASNPNGAWRYGYLTELGGSFGLLHAPRTFTADNGVPISVWELSLYQLPIVAKVMGPDTAHSDGTHFTAAPGTIYFAAGADNAPQNFGVIRFVVPPDKAGQYRLETSVQSLFDFDRSRDADFHVLKNGDELFGQFLPPNSGTSYSNTIVLAAGDTIDFAIGRGADGTTYNTGLKIQATLTPLTINPPLPPSQSFDLSADFSLAANPNGVWRYGYLTELGGTFGLLGAPRTFGADNGVPISVWELSLYHLPIVAKVMGPETAHSDGNHFTAVPGTIYFAPGADNAPENYGAIRFVVPPDRAGTYRLVTSVRSLFDFERSRDADFHVLKNGQELFGQALPPNSGTSYSNTLFLAAGDTIDFAIGRGADGTTYDTGLKIQATLTPLTINPPVPPGTNCVPPPNGLAAFWSFEDAATTGLQLTGNPVFAEGKVGRSLQFDGVNDQALAPASPGLDVGTADGFSIETWVNPAHVTMQPIAEWTLGTSGAVHFWIGVYGSGSIFANLVDIHQQSHSWRSDTDIVVPNEWQHVAMSYEKSTGLLRFYLNGRKVTEHSVGLISPQTSYPLAIGYRPDQEHFAGRIDELAIYRRALSDAEFAAIHAAGSRGKCLIPGTPGPVRPGFDLARDYSTNTNPSGVWSYGWKSTLAGTFNLFGYHGFSFEGGTLIDYWLKSDHGPSSVYHNSGPATLVNNDGAGTYPPGTVWFGPGYDQNPDNFSVIRFTVPGGTLATYRLTTEVRPALDGPIAGDTDFHVLKNGTELFGRNLPANAGTNFATLVSLASGDTIDFVCGRGADGQAYASALKIQATLTPFTNSVPPSLDELVRLVHTIPAPADPQSLLDGLEAVRASILRGNFLSALQQLADFQNNARALLGAMNPSLSAQIISLAQFVIETLDPTGARRSELLVIRNIPMRVLRVQAIEQSEGIWWVQGCARPGSVCCVQRSLNLQDWEHAGFATEVTDGIFEWIDVTPGPGPRFYRLLEP